MHDVTLLAARFDNGNQSAITSIVIAVLAVGAILVILARRR
jgi:hypothetical protein